MTFGNRPGVALVIGGSGGIGAAIVELLRQRGSEVVATYRSTPIEGGRQLDTSDPKACAELMESLADDEVHTLVYAAGPHVPMIHLSKVEPTILAQQIAADAGAFFNVVQPALPLLRHSQGNIVAITTAATSRYPVRDGLSAVPKAAVEEMAKALAVEEGRYGVRVNCVGPGMLTDGMARRLIDDGELDGHALEVTRKNIPMHRFGSAMDIAEAVCFLASDAAGFISGQKLDVDGGYGV